MKLRLITIGILITLLGGIALLHSSQSLRGENTSPDVFVLRSSAADVDQTELNDLYQKWKNDFKGVEQVGILLGDSESAEINRISNFKENLKRISEHNKQYKQGEHTFAMGINQFSHLSAEEFKEMYLTDLSHDEERVKRYREDHQATPLLTSGGSDPTPYWKQASNLYYEAYKSFSKTSEESNRPKSIDWTEKIGTHKNQGTCGSCYSFTSTAAIQAVMGVKESLSVQEILDCDSRNNGCKGGIPQKVFSYVMYNGVGLDSAYPYKMASSGDCNVNFEKGKRVQIADFFDVQSSVEALETALLYGPVATAIDASTLQGYQNGLFNSKTCKTSRSEANHAVLIVGYTNDAFIVRNSWGQHWGESGNFRVPKRADSIGVCGLYNDMSYPTKK